MRAFIDRHMTRMLTLAVGCSAVGVIAELVLLK
ncbi:hypothetical protein EV561_105361 [Rhizobium sp. BK376]|jgi:hypothetical protein|nr:hypothetical protein EV561_105361 [Rhizobium sp. BK376]